MKRWTVELRPAAQKDLKKLDEGPQREAVEDVEDAERLLRQLAASKSVKTNRKGKKP